MKKIILLFLLSALPMLGQNSSSDNSKSYVSKKGLYQIKYNPAKWHEEINRTNWDAEFGDQHKLLSAYFTEYNYLITEKHLKSTTNAEFSDYGKIKKFKTYKKQISGLTVNYLEFELDYKGNTSNYKSNTCKYQGFIYNGKGGTIELLFAGQIEDMEKNQDVIDELCNGLSLIN